MHHVQNKCIESILFTNESHHEYARTLISRACGTSPTQIDNWHVAPEKWHHKQKPKTTYVTCVNTTQEMASQTKAQSNQRHLCQHMEKWSRPPHPRPSTPFGSDHMPSTIKTYGTSTVLGQEQHVYRKRWLRKFRVEHGHESVQSRQHRHLQPKKINSVC